MEEKVSLNKASAIELQKIIHIGPVRATRIIEGRPFRDKLELSKILGLGETRMMQIFEQGLVEI